MSWFLYVLECRDGSLYTGICRSPAKRVAEHNRGSRGAKYTRSRRPVALRSLWEYPDRSSALKAEHAFKQLSRNKKLEQINGTNKQHKSAD